MSRRRQRKNPFSLFAFQDIITAVTGIMLLITLMLTLELVERKTKALQASSPSDSSTAVAISAEELARLESEVAALQKQSAQIQSENAMLAQYDARQLREEWQKIQQSNEEDHEKIRRLKKVISDTDSRREEIRNAQDPTVDVPKKIEQIQEKLKKIKSSRRIFIKGAQGSTKTNWLVEVTAKGLKVAPLGRTTPPSAFSDANQFKQWLARRDQDADHFVLFVQKGGVKLYKQASQVLEQGGYSKGFDVLQQADHIIDDTTGAGIP